MAKHFRSLNPLNGFYYALGPRDMFPAYYQDFETINNV